METQETGQVQVEVLPDGEPGTVLDVVKSKEELEKMDKPDAAWLAKSVKVNKMFFSRTMTAKRKLFTKGNQGLIYRGNICMRTAPFICKTDANDSNQSWAEFETCAFLGKNLPKLPWERASIKITCIPIKKTEDYFDTLNGDGFLMKFDEISMTQLPMYWRYSDEKMAESATDNSYIAQNLLLRQRLQHMEKPHHNWTFLGFIIVPIIIIALIAGFFILFPNAWTGIVKWFGGLGGIAKNLMPPSGALTPPKSG